MTWFTYADGLPQDKRPVLVELVNPWRNMGPVIDAGSFDGRRGWWSFFCYKYIDGWKVRRWAELPQPQELTK
jgi:hypothetical protein